MPRRKGDASRLVQRGEVWVVGVGPGGWEYLLPVSRRAIEGADVLVGSRRHLERFGLPGKRLVPFPPRLDGVEELVESERAFGQVAVLLSGDPCFHSLLPRLRSRFGREGIRVFPGLSSFQLLFCRLALPWDDVPVVSLHGGRGGVEGLDFPDGGICFLCDPAFGPRRIAELLVGSGRGDWRMFVGESLGEEGERVVEGSALEVRGLSFDGPCVVLVLPGGDGFVDLPPSR